MQRLRGLKQLGVSEMTYVPTTHCRFEHSLGVASLSMEVLCEIAKKQPLLNITEKDIVCVKIAGLLHDIGHGPFSHVYDGQFRKQLRRAEREGVWLGQKFDRSLYDDDDVQEGKGGKRGYKDVNNHNGNDNDNDSFEGWEHEDGSLMMIDALLKYLGLEIDSDTRHLDLPLRQIGDGIDANCFGIYDFALGESYHQSRNGNGGTQTQPCYDGKTPLPNDLVLTSRDWIFIKECILGGPLPPKGMTIHKAKKLKRFQPLIGRPDRLKEFLYDVVSNRHSGLDVDKVDYLARDERYVYI
jgi:HD superfamily phosphohydrolase